MTAGLPIVDRALPHLVGYNRSPQHLSESLLAGRSVIVFGASGFGKTILLEAIVATLVSSGAEPIRIRASVQSHPAPFSSITDGSNLRLSQAVGGEDSVPRLACWRPLSRAAAVVERHLPGDRTEPVR